MTKPIKYKNTGLEWCPQIPEHWEVKKLKYVALVQPSNVDKKSEKDEINVKLCNYVDVYKNDYITEDLSFMEATAKKSEIDKYKLIVGDVIITKDSESPQDIAVPAYVKSTKPNLLCGYHLAQIRSNNTDVIGNYLFRLFQSKMFNTNFEIGANGITRYGLGLEVTQSTYIPLPPLLEQQKIADYLDEKTSLIDSIISKKEKQIELYKEERTAAINQAVTKGLNPDVKMKDSGIEWLGSIPKHWEVKKLKYVALVQPSNVDKKSEKDEINVKLCNYVDVYKNDYITKDLSFMEATAKKSEIEKYKLIVGDVIITKDSESPQDIAVPAYVKSTEPNLLCGYHLAQIRSNNIDVIGNYLFRLFQSKMFNANFEIGANGITRYGLGLEVTQSTYIPLPPLSKQQEIVTYLDNETNRIDTLVSKTSKQIELLKEYKEALINEVVTGQRIIH